MIRRPLVRGAVLFGSLLLFVSHPLAAQEQSLEELLPGFKERAVVMDIIARIVEQNQQEVWNSVNSRITIPGRPVGIKLVGANLVVAVQFTPYRRRNGNTFLVAQGQIWIDVPNQGIQYQTTIETIPLEFGEPVYFFPLGSVTSPDETRIELQIQLYPYRESPRYQAEKQDPPPEQDAGGSAVHSGGSEVPR